MLRPESLWPQGYRTVRASRALDSQPLVASAFVMAGGAANAKRLKSAAAKKGAASPALPSSPLEGETHAEVLTIRPANGASRCYDAEVRVVQLG